MVRFLAEFRDAANPHYDLSAEKLDTNNYILFHLISLATFGKLPNTWWLAQL